MRFFTGILMCAGALFFSCTDEVDKIVLSSERVMLWAGTDTVVTIAGDVKAYTVTSSDENVARASIVGGDITITTSRPGDATIQIADADRVATIQVEATTFFGVYRRMTDSRKVDPQIEVVAADAAVAETLKNQIRAELDEELSSQYEIVFSPTDGKYWEYHHKRTIVREGPYSYSNLILTLNDDEVYAVVPNSIKFVGLRRDLTEIYQQQYPEAEITSVKVTKYLHLYLPPG